MGCRLLTVHTEAGRGVQQHIPISAEASTFWALQICFVFMNLKAGRKAYRNA